MTGTTDDRLEALRLRLEDLQTESEMERQALRRERDIMRELITESVTAGIRAAAADPAMWSAASQAMHRMARDSAGGWLLGGLRAVASRAAWVLAIGIGVYLLGGWSALVAAVKSAIHGGGPPGA